MQPVDPQPLLMPTTPEELKALGWSQLDVILVSGDTYVDAPHIGVAVIGRVLLNAGYRVGMIAQPDIHSAHDITRLGEPGLFWGVSSGCVDSMIANFTPAEKRRKSDDMTPGGINNRRPDRAVLAYSHLIRRHFKQTCPIVLGGIEASLRRISHYDAWSGKVRRAIIFDAKADYLLYGMAEQSVLALAERLKKGKPATDLRGLCYISKTIPPDHFPGDTIELPPHAAVTAEKALFAQMFKQFYANNDPATAKRLYQRQDTRYLVHNPPMPPLAPQALDAIYALPFTRQVHPFYLKMGEVRAMETIRFSLTTHRGCFGECRFCAIAVHQGRQVISRSREAIVAETRAMTEHPDFKGIISDAGGPTANMYGMSCTRRQKGVCPNKSCLYPKVCKHLNADHRRQIELLDALRHVPGVRKVFVASGLRYDLIISDHKAGRRYLETLLRHHTSGQLKIAPEHIDDDVLKLMGKPDRQVLEAFMRLFGQINRQMNQKHFLTYYLMAAHPGCTLEAMQRLRAYVARNLKIVPEQVQIFTPSPSTYATLMYYHGIDPFGGQKIFVEKTLRNKLEQKAVLSRRPPPSGNSRRKKPAGKQKPYGGPRKESKYI